MSRPLDYGPCRLECGLTYNSAMSKNKRFGRGWKNQTYIQGESKVAEDLVRQEIRAAYNGIPFFKNKIYIDLTIVKPRANIDAINFLDAVADCIKDVINIDDNWFSIKALEWEINSDNPKMELRLFQPFRFHTKYCSKCGRNFPPTLDYFNLSRKHPEGLNTRCKDCIRGNNKERATIARLKKKEMSLDG